MWLKWSDANLDLQLQHWPQLQPRPRPSPSHDIGFIWSGLITPIQYDCSVMIALLHSAFLIFSSCSDLLSKYHYFRSATIRSSLSPLWSTLIHSAPHSFLYLTSFISTPICSAHHPHIFWYYLLTPIYSTLISLIMLISACSDMHLSLGLTQFGSTFSD